MGEGGDGGVLSECVDLERAPRFLHLGDQLRRPRCIANAQAREPERLGEGAGDEQAVVPRRLRVRSNQTEVLKRLECWIPDRRT